MANRYWNPTGAGNWSSTSSWAATDGGATGVSVPWNSDDVYFTSTNVNNCTVDSGGTRSCNNLTMTGYTGTITYNTYIYVYGNTITSWSGTVHSNSSWYGFFTQYAGIVSVDSASATLPSIFINASSQTIKAVNNNLICNKVTLSSGTSTTLDANNLWVTFTVCDGADLPPTLSNFTNLTVTGYAYKSSYLALNWNLTLSGTITVNGNSAINRLLIRSSTVGTSRTISAATVSMSYVDLQDITWAGAWSWNLSAITGKSWDCGGNSNITFTTGTTTNWQSGTTWSTATWSVRVPLPQDTATFTTAGTVTITQDMPRIGAVDFTGSSNKTWTTSTACSFFGSINLTNLSTLTNSTQLYTYEGRGTSTITSAGKVWAKGFTINAPWGTLNLWSDLDVTATNVNTIFNVTRGTFTTNNYNLTTGIFTTNNSNTRTINLWSSTIECKVTNSTAFVIQGTTWLTFNAGTSTIKTTWARTSEQKSIIGWAASSVTFYNVWLATTGAYAEIIDYSSTFNDIKINAGKTVKFATGTTQTVNTFTATGTAWNLITLDSTTTGTYALAKAGGGTISCDYLSVQHSVASPANTWYAGLNSTNNQSVATAGSGWLFEVPVMLYTKTVAEVIAIASTLQNLSQKIFAQSVTVASVLRLGFIKDMIETITLSPTFVKYVSKPLSNALSVVSSFGSVGTFFRDMIEYLAVSEIFEKWVYKLQAFTETISIVSNTVKQGMKNMVDSLSVVDRLAKSIYHSLVDSITLVSGHINARVKILTQSISVVDRVSKATSKGITNTISIASRLARSWGVILSKETITIAGSCVKSVFRAIINAISISALAIIRITGFTIREAITISGSVRKSISHKISNAIAISSRLARGFFFRASGAISIADSIKKSPMKLLRDILAINKSFSMKLNGILLDLWSRATKSVTDTWTRATKTITDPWKRTPKN